MKKIGLVIEILKLLAEAKRDLREGRTSELLEDL